MSMMWQAIAPTAPVPKFPQQPAEILVHLGVRISLDARGAPRRVDVAQGDDRAAGLLDDFHVASPLPADADAGHVKPIVRSERAAWDVGEGERRGGGRGLA